MINLYYCKEILNRNSSVLSDGRIFALGIRGRVKGEQGMEQELLEQEINTYREKVRRCSSKEEVWQIKEDYEDALLLGISVVESNPVLSLQQKLEFTMLKDTKLSMMAKMIEEFAGSPEYEALPDRAEGAKEAKESHMEMEPLSPEEELKRMLMKRAKAMNSYAGSRKGTDGQEPTPFDAKG